MCIRDSSGALPIAAAAGSAGMKRCFLPISNVKEGQIIENIDIIGVENIKELAAVLNDPDRLLSLIHISSLHWGLCPCFLGRFWRCCP